MMNYGFNEFGMLLVLFFWCILPLAWIILSIFALLSLKGVRLNQTAHALWALLIVLVPLLGAVAYLLVRPDEGAGGVG